MGASALWGLVVCVVKKGCCDEASTGYQGLTPYEWSTLSFSLCSPWSLNVLVTNLSGRDEFPNDTISSLNIF